MNSMGTHESARTDALVLLLFAALAFTTIACSPEVGSDHWCKEMKESPKADWSTNDATAFAKNCVFK